MLPQVSISKPRVNRVKDAAMPSPKRPQPARTATRATAEAQARVIEAGGVWLHKVLLNAEERALWDRARDKFGGSAKATILAGLRALEGPAQLSNETLVELLKGRLGVR